MESALLLANTELTVTYNANSVVQKTNRENKLNCSFSKLQKTPLKTKRARTFALSTAVTAASKRQCERKKTDKQLTASIQNHNNHSKAKTTKITAKVVKFP